MRPHHLPILILGAFGHIRAPDQFFYDKLEFRGYGPQFSEHLKNIQRKIRKNPSGVLIEIVLGLDDVCEGCGKAQKARPACWKATSEYKHRLPGLKVGQSYTVEEVLKMLGVNPNLRRKYVEGGFSLSNLQTDRR